MHKHPKRLRLNRETIRTLSSAQLGDARGGVALTFGTMTLTLTVRRPSDALTNCSVVTNLPTIYYGDCWPDSDQWD